MALSDTAVKALKPRAKDYKINDGGGLYLVVRPNGTRLWRMDYMLHGKRRSVSFGVYPDTTIALARERRLEARQLLSAGIDPSLHKQQRAKKAALETRSTFKHVADEYMVAAVKKGSADRTMERTRHIFKQYVIPKLGHRDIGTLKASDVLEVLTYLESRNLLETARRTRQLMSAVFRLAVLTDRAATDPTVILQRHIKSPRVTSFPAVVHEEGFGELLRAIETYPTPIVRLALKFSALVFARPGEVRLATWDEIDIEDGIWRIPASRTKRRRDHDVPLSAATVAVLAEARKLCPYNWETNGFVFPTPHAPRKPMSENTLGTALKRLGYRGKHSAHGFRASASSILRGRGTARAEVIEAQLAHLESSETVRAYNRSTYWDERVRVMSDWARICFELRDGKKPKTKMRVRAYADLIG